MPLSASPDLGKPREPNRTQRCAIGVVTHFLAWSHPEGVRSPLEGLSDADLLRFNNADGFAELYDRHAARVLGWARLRVGDYAADLTAEVFAQAWRSRGRFKDQAGGSALPGYSVSRRTCCERRSAKHGLRVRRELLPRPTTGRGAGSGDGAPDSARGVLSLVAPGRLSRTISTTMMLPRESHRARRSASEPICTISP